MYPGPRRHRKATDFIQSKFLRIICSQVNEDGFNRQKNVASNNIAYRYSKPEKAYAVPVQRKVLSQVHRYTDILPESSLVAANAKLARSVFMAKGESAGVKRKDIVSSSQTPKWYSPGPANLPQGGSDMTMLRRALESNDLGSVANAWLGAFCNPNFDMVVRRLPDGQWLSPLHHISGSCCLFWPCIARSVGHPAMTILEPDLEARSIVIEPIFSLSCWEGWRYVWRSPAWQWHGSMCLLCGLRGVRFGQSLMGALSHSSPWQRRLASGHWARMCSTSWLSTWAKA